MNRRVGLLSILGAVTAGLAAVAIATSGPSWAREGAWGVTVHAAPGNGITLFAPAHFTRAQLAAMPQVTDTVTIDGVSTSETGPTLVSVLTAAGATYLASSTCKNDELRYWILASGDRGADAAVTAGEIDPAFGQNVAILSLSENGNTAGTPRLVMPGDKTDARDIAGVSDITIGRAAPQLLDSSTPGCTSSVSSPPVSPAPATGSVVINGDVAHPMTLTYDQLMNDYPQVSQTDSFLGPHGTSTNTESGPTLFDVVSAAEPEFRFCKPSDDLGWYVEVTSNEVGYTALVSWGELDPAYNGNQTLLSLLENGKPTDQAAPAGTGDTDPRFTVPGDIHGGRYVNGAAVITVFRAPGASFGDSDSQGCEGGQDGQGQQGDQDS